jgi:hypothetical protein
MAISSSPVHSGNVELAPAGPLFELGQTVATPAALASLNEAGVSALVLLRRHQYGDFGKLCSPDRKANVDAIQIGARVFSSYSVGLGRIWIITEAMDDRGFRPSTCLLLPEEY